MRHLSVILVVIAFATAAQAKTTPAAPADPYADIQKTLGFVPSFFHSVSDEAVGAWWDQMKALQLNPKTALSNKVKELIGLGVASQIPCKYCIYFHTTAAKALGASDREVQEAVAMAATTRHWSTTINGHQLDESEFRRDVDAILTYAGSSAKKPAPMPLSAIVDAKSAYKDIEAVLGRVPGFLKAYPPVAIAAAWRVLRSVQLNPTTALSPKEKELIALGVAAQIPCKYCTYFHTKTAKAFGASDLEVCEAIAMSGLTRFGSTVLWGGLVDDEQFKRDVDRIFSPRRQASR